MSACAGSQVGETHSVIKAAAEVGGNIMLHQIEERLNDIRQEKGQESQNGDNAPKETTLKGSNGVPGLNNLNKQAILLARSGDHVGATACLTHLLEQARRCNVTHPELYVCLSNRCNSFLALECFSEALEDARQALLLIQKAFPGGRHAFHPLFTKVTVRMGQALLGMCCHREALMAFEDALKLNPDNIDARVGLERAHQAMLRSVLQGENLERRALPPPAPSLRIASLPHSSPAHHIRCEDRLPTQLLTPFQAERDPSTRDIYNYCTVQADTRLPLRYLDQYLQDRQRLTLSSQAVQHAVQEVQARGVDCRVLIVGSGAAGLMAMVALKAGALHVTCVERWMYMAQSCREVLVHNGASLEDFKVVCKRPCDLTSEDVPIPPNLVIACDLIDEGILTGGLLTAVKSVMQKGLVMLDAVIIPSSITVKVQAMQAQTAPSVCGIQLGALDRYRWLTGPAGVCSASHMRQPAASRPSTSTHLPEKLLTSDSSSSSSCETQPPPPLPYIFRPLSEPQECWTFDLYCPPEESCHKHVDLEMKVEGNWNAVLYWAEVCLYRELSWSTGFGQHAENCHHDQKCVTCASIQPALQYMAGSLAVHPQMVLPLLASHNTVRLKFDLEEGEYQYLHKRDASLPRHHFAMAADTVRLEAYNKALKKAVQLIKTGATASATPKSDAIPALSHTSVQALDLGCGTGVLAMLAARAGADHVVAVEAHPTLCDIARRNVAMNGLSRKVRLVLCC
ncbi:hypothetical protein CEUSTIGMA_g13037.t1 [Chlamydomonas eustigma]|uniref:type I protein arginine methyltransferase n=1 Tax=Chlamydomonas eustigma TaxID=1157962 RepID=A0A250XRR5_9CHLO|nr:hypothetical protein CEUSTIGMA_g13037.t1 [Chlamydomonas eustigma]|eukprot:GAX85622.1 hypothetical protein CEUSTIGMA_g13037.t1 [Chlamydomonas eustigma]